MNVHELRAEYLALLRRNGVDEELKRFAATEIDEDAIYDEAEEALVASGLDPARARSVVSDVKSKLDGAKEGYNLLLRDMDKEVRDGLEEMGLSAPHPVYAASYPHGSFNAQACMTSAGDIATT